MKKIVLSLITVALCTGALLAQSVDQGKKFLYYQRYKSAKDQFDKLLAANPNNIDAVYWLGQTLLEDKNQAGAKDLYQKTLTSNGTAPLVLVGMGHIELLEGKANDARQRFETAISLTKAKDVEVLNAIARANVDAKDGDANYAIEKLNTATQIKGFKNADTYLLLGDAYRKLVDGGAAVTAYQKALTIDPKNAAAKYKIGKIYLTQGNKDYFLPAFEESIQLDPNYAPSYYELYYYWYYHQDVPKAITYFDKYRTVTDPKPSDEYDSWANFYAAKKYSEAIAGAQAVIGKEGANADPRYYKLIAYSYFDQNDSVNAKKWLDDYFTKQKTEGYVPMDYSFRAQLLAKFPGNEAEAFNSFEKAVALDTVVQSKIALMTQAADLAKKIGNRVEQAKWLGKIYYNDPRATKTDLYNYGFAYYQAKVYDSAAAVFDMYKQKFADEVFGYFWGARARAAIDTTAEQGLALPDYEKLVDVAKKSDSVKYKSMIIESFMYKAGYLNNVKKDKDSAIVYLNKVLEIDPANATAKQYIDVLSKQPAPKQQKQTPASPATKPKTGGTATGSRGK
jgi:tetratricopeptide (TPR) repeat protein